MTRFADLRLAVRRIRSRSSVSLGIVLVLSGAIGANTLVFSLMNGVLLRPLPFRDPERLVSIQRVLADDILQTIPYADYDAWRTRTGVVEDVAGISRMPHDVVFGGRRPREVLGGWVTPNFFTVVGPRLVLGRPFTADDHGAGHGRAVILTESLWRTHLAADPGAIGSRITVKPTLFPELAGDYVVVGVIGASLRSQWGDISEYEVFFPCPSPPPAAFASSAQTSAFEPLIGRLKPGVTLDQAREAVSRLARELGSLSRRDVTTRAIPVRTREVLGGKVTPLHETELGWTRQGLAILATGVGLVLLTACINVAALLSADGLRRRHEFALRSALGAGRGRLMREILLEHLLLGLAGGTGGVALAALGTPLMLAVSPANLPRVDQVHLDLHVIGFAVLATLVSVLLFGGLPAASLSARSLGFAINARTGAATARGRRGRDVLVAVQMALTVALLVGTLLAVRSLWNLISAPLGFDPAGVIVADLSVDRYTTDESARRRLHDRLVEEARRLPGATAAALSLGLPSVSRHRIGILVPGIEGNSRSGRLFVEWRSILGDYLDVFQIAVRIGRRLTPGDRLSGAVLVNESFARRYLPGGSPLGRWIDVAGPRQVVGVVADAREQSATQPTEPMVYDTVQPQHAVALSVRTRASMAVFEPALQSMLERLDPHMPARITTMEAILARGRAPTRFYALVLGTFAVFALLLAGTGVFTLSYYMVSERSREFGVRLALGARPFVVGRSVVLRMLGVAMPALVVGGAAGIAGSRVLRSVLYGLTVTDPLTLAGTGVLMVVLSVLASFGPARRAASLDPALTLRQE